ncbi:MAG: YhgE/Pip domain-containing protein [Dermabacter sp.]|nr:YhgE/Pip domain-containing protein [Dermabacter sp.]
MPAITNFFRRHSGTAIARTAIIMLGIATIPLMYAGLLSWSNIDPTNNLDSVPAAIVNEDEGTDSLDLGDTLSTKLLDSTASNNFDWTRMSASEASQALEDGEVYAILTIPKDFSADASSVGADDPADARRATLTITTNDGTNMISGTIAATIATTVTDELDAQVSDEYLRNIYAGFNTIHENLTDAASGAEQLASGAGDAKDGSGQLVVGLGDLKDGTVTLSSGAGQVDAGAKKLDTAAGQLAAGAGQVNTGAVSLKGGIDQAKVGSGQLATGLDQMETAATELPGALTTLKEGTGALATGAEGLATGAEDFKTGTGKLSQGASELSGGADKALAGARTLQQNTGGLASGSSTLATGAKDLETDIAKLKTKWNDMTEEERVTELGNIQKKSEALSTGTTNLETSAKALNLGAGALVGSPAADGTDATGLEQLAGGAKALSTGADALDTKAGDLVTGAEQLKTGATTLDAGAGTLQEKVGALPEAVTALSDGATQLDGGLAELSQGAGRLTTGTGQLATGSAQLATGTGDLSTATSQLSTGANTLSEGATSAEEGATTLDEGLGSLSEGATELEGGLQDGAGKVPTYTDEQAADLATVGSRPVDLEKTRENEVASYGYGLAPYFMSLSLWVGALGFFLMVNALNARRLGSEMPAIMVALSSYAPAALMAIAQAVLMILTVHVLVGISFSRLAPAFGVAILASLAFMAINQALVALLGPPGRYLSLMLTVLQLAAAGATYPIETTPGFFQSIHAWLPLTYVVEAFRSAIAGGSYGFGQAALVLGTYLVIALGVLALAVRLKRRVTDVKLELLERKIAAPA